MPHPVVHFSQHLLGGTLLQVLADESDDLTSLIEAESAVFGRYAQAVAWPHKRVNMFVLQDLGPIVAQIGRVVALPTLVAEDLGLGPMVNLYDLSNFEECSIFVNRGALERTGQWTDAAALQGLLAHEHGHPLGENRTTASVRHVSLAQRIAADRDSTIPVSASPHDSSELNLFGGMASILQSLFVKLTVKAPQEIFANETAIRAGFGEDLYRLDERHLATLEAGLSRRGELVDLLGRAVAEQRLDEDRKALLLLVGDLQIILPFALETSAFLRTHERAFAERLDARLFHLGCGRISKPVLDLYDGLRDHCATLDSGLSIGSVRAWCEATVTPLVQTLAAAGLELDIGFPAMASPEPSGARPAFERALNETTGDR
ncbi:MAG: hypothetical protein ACLQIQ_04465 [Beijerinckiaceae bacterium]